MKSKIINSIAEGGEVLARKLKREWDKNGEKWLTKGGTTGLIGSGIYAVKKTNDIADLLKETREDVKRAKESGDKKEIRKARLRRGRKVGKHYILPIVGATVSTMMIDNGMAKAGEKTMAMAATATLYATTLRQYRKNVIDDLGVEADRKYMTTTKIKGKISEVEMSDGTKVTETGSNDGYITLPVEENALRIMYSREMCPDSWHDSLALRRSVLESIETELDVMLMTRPSLTLNEMRRKFGSPKDMDVPVGFRIGRVYDPGNPQNPTGGRRINLHWRDDKDFVEGRKDWCWIIFDIDDVPIDCQLEEMKKFMEVEKPWY